MIAKVAHLRLRSNFMLNQFDFYIIMKKRLVHLHFPGGSTILSSGATHHAKRGRGCRAADNRQVSVQTFPFKTFLLFLRRLYRPKEEISLPSAEKSPQKQSKVSFDQENLIENKVDKLEKMLTEKLSVGQDVQDDLEKQLLDKESELLDKNAETMALEKRVAELKEVEEKMRKELEEAKEEGVRMADQLAAQAKEQMDSVKVKLVVKIMCKVLCKIGRSSLREKSALTMFDKVRVNGAPYHTDI